VTRNSHTKLNEVKLDTTYCGHLNLMEKLSKLWTTHWISILISGDICS